MKVATRLLPCVALLAAAAGALGCDSFDSPPVALLPQAVQGMLPDPAAPVVLAFSEPVAPGSLSVKLIRYQADIEGRLFDEDDAPDTALDVLFESGPDPASPGQFKATDWGVEDGVDGTVELDTTRQLFSMWLLRTLPIGPRLAVLVEPGLSDDAGNSTRARQVLQFGFAFSCSEQAGSKIFPDGVYFFLLDVERPVGTQLQLFAAIEVDRDTGSFVGQFTDGDRNPDPNRCAPPCEEGKACRTLPPPAQCVTQSEKGGTVDEYPDWLPAAAPPEGFSFTVQGCVQDLPDAQGVAFGNAPVDAVVYQPAVTAKGIDLSASFAYDEQHVFRGAGSFTAEQVFLGTTPSGPGTGTHTARLIPEDEVPPGVPPSPHGP